MLIVLPVAYFPPVSWMAFFLNAEKVMLEQYETYPKQTIRNHCDIMAANGRLRLSVPVKKPFGNKSKTNQILTDNTPWPVRHLRSLASAYRKTPYYQHFEDEIQRVLLSNHESLVQLDTACLSLSLKMLRSPKAIELSTDFVRPQANTLLLTDFESFVKSRSLTFPPYLQTFSERFGFIPNLSILDLVFNLGPHYSLEYLKRLGEHLLAGADEANYSG